MEASNWEGIYGEPEGQELEFNTPQDELFRATYGDYRDEEVYYAIDYIDLVDLEERGFFSKLNFLRTMKDSALAGFYYAVNLLFVEFPFNILKSSTNVIITILNFAYDFNVVNDIIDAIASRIRSMAGVSLAGEFRSSGLFGGFLGLIAITVAIYTLYQFIVKKASISAFSSMLKSIIALTLALLFFSNYATFLKGANTLATEATALILTGQPNITLTDEGTLKSNTLQNEVNTNIWNVFVHKPYLLLQYGTMDEEEIGKQRIFNLLQLKPGTEERYELVEQEITENGNEMMTRGKISERLVILLIAMFANLLNAIPVFILTFALILFQFWFIVMALIAPFVFLWGAFPNQFGVITRYGLELITPLLLKIGVSVLALIIFSLTDVILSVADDNLFGFIVIALCQGVLFITLFLLRHRIMDIFSSGSREFAHIRNEMSGSISKPIKTSVQKGASTAGTLIGGATGGATGAIVGASVGSSIGKGLTGEQSVGEVARDIAFSKMIGDRMNLTQEEQGIADNVNEIVPDIENEDEDDNDNKPPINSGSDDDKPPFPPGGGGGKDDDPPNPPGGGGAVLTIEEMDDDDKETGDLFDKENEKDREDEEQELVDMNSVDNENAKNDPMADSMTDDVNRETESDKDEEKKASMDQVSGETDEGNDKSHAPDVVDYDNNEEEENPDYTSIKETEEKLISDNHEGDQNNEEDQELLNETKLDSSYSEISDDDSAIKPENNGAENNHHEGNNQEPLDNTNIAESSSNDSQVSEPKDTTTNNEDVPEPKDINPSDQNISGTEMDSKNVESKPLEKTDNKRLKNSKGSSASSKQITAEKGVDITNVPNSSEVKDYQKPDVNIDTIPTASDTNEYDSVDMENDNSDNTVKNS